MGKSFISQVGLSRAFLIWAHPFSPLGAGVRVGLSALSALRDGTAAIPCAVPHFQIKKPHLSPASINSSTYETFNKNEKMRERPHDERNFAALRLCVKNDQVKRKESPTAGRLSFSGGTRTHIIIAKKISEYPNIHFLQKNYVTFHKNFV